MTNSLVSKRLTFATLLTTSLSLTTFISLAACKSTGKAASGPAPETVKIEFAGKAGSSFDTMYHSNSRVRKYAEGQITNDRTESIDFTVRTKTTGVKDGQITSVVRTVEKDGTSSLHDLAFPELNEEIEFVVKPSGEVVKAGKYLPQSIYFVPSLPTPGRPVAVGDTWTMEHTWYSAHEGIPLKLSVVGILKDIVRCEGGYCADVEVNGGVNLALAPTVAGARFDSRVWGRVLFSLDRGDVIWSEMRSKEEMSIDKSRSLSESCMISRVKFGKVEKLGCDPNEQPVAKVPSL